MKKTKTSVRAAATRTSAVRGTAAGVLLFALALALRLLFWQATPDAVWPYSAFYKGDAPIWLGYAQALLEDRPFELGLPLRPPGAAYLTAALWDGRPDSIAALRFWWCLLGALTVPLLYGAVRKGFGFGVALVTGLLCAASSGLMMLSTALDNETPYLLLVAATLYLGADLIRRPRTLRLASWAGLHGLACLVRVEHALFFVLVAAWAGIGWLRAQGADRRQVVSRAALAAAVFALVLLPWHLHAWRTLRSFNAEERGLNPATEAAMAGLERALADLSWAPDAIAARERLPAFIRRTSANFVAATVGLRGGRRVEAADFEILEEAFGYLPEPVAEHPFVALYGGLNFYLANNPRSTGGFDRSILDRPPPLAGGAGRYPAMLVAGLPPPDLALAYPPHLEIVNHGYRLGWRYLREHPGDGLALAARKLATFWEGAALGYLGYNLPLGLSGVRRSVDLVVPVAGLGPTLWRLAVLVAVLVGLWTALRSPSLRGPFMPWLLFLGSKLAVTAAFFGYARQGATVFPVIALALALAAARCVPSLAAGEPAPRWLRGAVAAALALVAVEAVRWLSGPAILIDGRPAGAVDPWPAERHQERRVEVR